MSKGVSYELANGVARIILDDGKVNVMSTTMLGEIGAAFDRAEKEAEIAVLRSARPGIFSAGFDLKVFAASDAAKSLDMVRAGAELALRLAMKSLKSNRGHGGLLTHLQGHDSYQGPQAWRCQT